MTDDAINGDGLTYTSNVNGETYTIQAAEDYAETYGAAVGAYVEHVSGSAILVKSTSADIVLDDVTVDSYSGVAIHTALNSDSMSRYLKQDTGAGVNVAITDSGIDGSVVHEDYQRDLSVTLSGSTLIGAVITTSAEEWNALWADYADDERACWVNLDADTYVTESHATALTLTNGSTWKVTAESRLTCLSVDETSTVEGIVLLDGEEVTLTAGETLEGDITVLPMA